MKTNKSFFASRMAMLVLACVLTMGLASCSKDDDDDKGIVGTWVNGELSYRFDSDGTGRYYSGGDVWGSINYTFSSNTVYMKIVYHNTKARSVRRDELSGHYNSVDDTFNVRGEKFTRKK